MVGRQRGTWEAREGGAELGDSHHGRGENLRSRDSVIREHLDDITLTADDMEAIYQGQY